MIHEKSAAELAHLLRKRELSAREIADAFVKRIEQRDGDVGAFLRLAEDVPAQAERAQTLIDEGRASPLTGIPVAVKDNFSTRGLLTTCASKILSNYIPPYDATAIERLREQGAIILGKTNLDEFAMGTSTETSAYQLTRNPWDLERSPGGSSGGSAAAVTAGFAPLGLGSDTGGSIRQPASLCGIVGFKPTYGRVSRYGLIAFGSSLDQIGPFAQTVEDAALLASAISGHDPRDSTSLPMAPIATDDLKTGSLRGLRVAVPREFFGDSMHAGVRQVTEQALDKLRAEGAQLEEVSLPSIQYGVTTYYIIAPAEASSNLARFDGIRFGPRAEGEGHIAVTESSRAEGFGHEVKARIMIGTYALSAGYYDAYYLRAQQVRGLMKREFDEVFGRFDVVVGPTSPVPAFRVGELKDDPMALKLLDFCTIPANMSGGPAISINAGLTEGLPVGLQIMAPVLGDERLLQTAYAVEQALGATVRAPFA